MSLEQQKPILQLFISRFIWNLRSSFQSKTKCSSFDIHFNRKPNTIWKQLASSKLSGEFLDEGKSILSKERALDWNADDRIEDGYKDSLVPKKNQSPLEKRYDSDYPTASKPSSSRVSLNSPFKGKILRKTKGSKNRNPFYIQLGLQIINSSKSAVELSDGKVIRKSDISIPKSKSSTTRYTNPDFHVGSRKTTKPKPQQTRKLGPKTRSQIELALSDKTRTRVRNQSAKPYKPRQIRNKASTSNTGYLAGDESMFIPSDTSDISDWEWIAGGFPCREMIRERLISDNHIFNEQSTSSLDPQTYQANIKSEILDEQPQSMNPLECPISIIPAVHNNTMSHPPTKTSTTVTTEGSNAPLDKTKKVEGENSVEFPIFKIEDSSDENVTTKESHPKETTITGNDSILRRSSRNVGPPQFYGKRLYIDIKDENDNQPGSSKNPISLDENDSSGSPPLISTKNPSDIQTPTFDIQSEESTSGSAISSSSEQISLISTDESLRDAVNSFDNYIDLDSEIFNAE